MHREILMWPLYAFYASVQCISLRRLEPLACAEGRVCVCMCHSSSSSSSCSALWCIRTLTFSQPHGSIFTGLAQAGKTVVYLSVHMKVCEFCSLGEIQRRCKELSSHATATLDKTYALLICNCSVLFRLGCKRIRCRPSSGEWLKITSSIVNDGPHCQLFVV